MLKRKRCLRIALETTPGTLVNATKDIQVFDLTAEPEESFVERKGSGTSLGHTSPGVLEGKRGGIMKFKAELKGKGDHNLDEALAILLQGCGFVYNSSAKTYAPTSKLIEQKTLSMACYMDGIKKQLAGAMGTVTITPNEGKLELDFEFKGVWQTPVDGALPTVSFNRRTPIPWAHSSNEFKLNNQTPKVSTFTFNLNNELVPRMNGGLIERYLVADRDPQFQFDPEAVLIADRDTYGDWRSGREMPFEIAVTDGTDKVTFKALKLQYREVPEGDRDKMVVHNITAQCNITDLAAGNDDITITIS